MPSPWLAVNGQMPASTRTVLWVHWERGGAVSNADVALLQHVRELGFAVVAVGNRDDGASGDFCDALRGVADVILQRVNEGYDFAAFREGLMWLRPRLAAGSTLLLLNNSCYGPFGSLQPLLERADPRLADVWSATSSSEFVPHLQSFLLLLHPAALAAKGFWRHWERMRPPAEKMDVVHACEIPLAAKLRKAGLRTAAVIDYDTLAARAGADVSRLGPDGEHPAYERVVTALRAGSPLNPTHDLWRWLPDAGLPLVKKDLLRVNPPGLPDAKDWRSHLPSAPVADLVELDLSGYR